MQFQKEMELLKFACNSIAPLKNHSQLKLKQYRNQMFLILQV